MSVTSLPSSLAGTWYPGEPSKLRALLQDAVCRSEQRTGPFLRRGALGFLVPHAAPVYSGTVASAVYRHVSEYGARRVILLGFSHRAPVTGIAVPQMDSYATPLGDVRLDRNSAARLAEQKPFHGAGAASLTDHSIEIQIPFLRMCCPEAAIVPLYVGRLGESERRAAAAVLRNELDGQTVIIASSDLTHYGHGFGYQPFDASHAGAGALRELDFGVLEVCGSLSPDMFRDYVARTGATVCGTAPVTLLLETLETYPGEVFMEVLDYDNSGSMTKDFTHSVSYGAAGFFPSTAFWLDANDQKSLLVVARESLDHLLHHGEETRTQPANAALARRGRIFVSLYEKNRVRGCVGCFRTPLPLAASAARLVVSSYEDHRFGPIGDPYELEIEIQVLTPPKRITDVERLTPGVHGAALTDGVREGLLLPIVAERGGLSRDEFLSELARKAGVPETAYSATGRRLSIFRVQRFGEHDFAGAA